MPGTKRSGRRQLDLNGFGSQRDGMIVAVCMLRAEDGRYRYNYSYIGALFGLEKSSLCRIARENNLPPREGDKRALQQRWAGKK